MEKRKVADCRKMPSDINCSLVIAGTEAEVIPVAVRHAIMEHGHTDTPELRQLIEDTLEDE